MAILDALSHPRDGRPLQVWKALREARVRSLYFRELAERYGRRQQWVQGLSLGFVTLAYVTLVHDSWLLVGAGCAAVAAGANVWAAATNLAQTHATLVRLRTEWEYLRLAYGELWSGGSADGVEVRFTALQRRASDLEVIASAGVPRDRKAVTRWEEFVDPEGSGKDAVRPGNANVISGSWPPVRGCLGPPPPPPPPPPRHPGHGRRP